MPAPRFASDSADASEEGRLIRAARTLATLARRLSRGVAGLAAASALAGGTLWYLLWWPVAFRPLPLLGAASMLVVLLGPTAVLALFYQGLHDLLALPERLSDRADRTVEQSAETVRSVTADTTPGFLGRLWGVVEQIWALRSVLQEHRALLVRYGALIRFATPGFLLLVVLAAGLGLLLVPTAAVAGLLAALL